MRLPFKDYFNDYISLAGGLTWYLVTFFCSFMPVFQAMFCAILYILHSLCNLEPACTYWFHLYIFIPFCFLHAVFLVCFFCTTFSCFHPLSSILQILVSVPPFHMHDLLDLVWGSSVKCGFYLVGFILCNMMLLCRKTKLLVSDKLKSYFFIYDNSSK